MDAKKFLEDFQDHLAPKLDAYEQVIYLYAVRHSRLLGQEAVVIGFKSARTRMALGLGKFGRGMSEGTVYEKLRGLAGKGCVRIVESTNGGTRLCVLLPEEIADVLPEPVADATETLDELDFFDDPARREAILRRDQSRCFYCLRTMGKNAWVIEHVVSRPEGSNGYRNLVAACRTCNNRKGALAARDFVRLLYREGVLGTDDLPARLAALDMLEAGELRPTIT